MRGKCIKLGIVLAVVLSTISGCGARLPSASGPVPALTTRANPGTRVLVYANGPIRIRRGELIVQYNPIVDSAAIEAITKIGQRHGFTVDTTTSRSTFAADRLAQYAAVVFLMNGAAELLPRNEAALQRFIRSGGGFVGLWSVDGSERSRPWYRRLVGTARYRHPTDPRRHGRQVQGTYVIHSTDPTHLSMRGVPDPWVIHEYYTEYAPLDSGIVVLATLDRRSFPKNFEVLSL